MLKRELKALKYIKKHPDVTQKKLYTKFPFLESDFHYISEYVSIDNLEPILRGVYEIGETKVTENSTFRLNRNGEQLFENKSNKFWSFILPYGITTLIAIGSLIARLSGK